MLWGCGDFGALGRGDTEDSPIAASPAGSLSSQVCSRLALGQAVSVALDALVCTHPPLASFQLTTHCRDRSRSCGDLKPNGARRESETSSPALNEYSLFRSSPLSSLLFPFLPLSLPLFRSLPCHYSGASHVSPSLFPCRLSSVLLTSFLTSFHALFPLRREFCTAGAGSGALEPRPQCSTLARSPQECFHPTRE